MLERLEVFNFKSYRGHQILGPLHPFTCIIGPNGSGKSNSMDAISFVLGVRSSMLRSNVLKDLVYRGPETEEGKDANEEERKAWVMAAYKDKNGKEWKFMRTITATGASSYFLNDKLVTYNKYNDTLMQHNILVKAKNFLVFQGDVEAVASQSPKDLSHLIEQISGSLELKQEYEAARVAQEKATENATFNYNKRRGLNSEIKQFKEQKSEALKFSKLKNQRTEAVIHHLLFQLYHINNMIEKHSEWIQEKHEELGEMRESIEKRERDVKKARKEAQIAVKEVQKVEKEQKKLTKQIEEEEPKLVEAEETVKHTVTKKAKAEKALQSVKKELDAKKKGVNDMEKELQETKKNARKHKEAAIKASAASGLQLSPQDLEEYQKLRGSANAKTTKERQDLVILSRQLKDVENELTTATDKLNQVNAQVENLENDQMQVSEKLETRKEKEKIMSTSLKDKTKELSDLRSERSRISQLQTELNEKLADCLSKIEQGRSEMQESRHQQRLKQLVVDLQRMFPGRVRGRVVDLCKPSARKYDVAVSVALGRHIDSIVVDVEKTGMDCVEYLRSQQMGIATFVPLDTIKVKPINDKYRNLGKGSRLAIDCIQYSPDVAKAMEYVCGDTLICDSTDIARHICFDRGQEIKAVTLEGTVIHRAGLITGGAAGLQANSKRWEQGEVEELEKLRDVLLAELQKHAVELHQLGSEEQHAAEVQRLKRDHTVAQDELNASQSKMSGIKEELKVLRNNVKSLSQDVRKLTAKRDEILAKRDSTVEEINAVDDEIFARFCSRISVANIQEYEGKTLEALEESEKAQVAFNKHINRLETQLKFENSQVEGLERRLSTINDSIKKFEKELRAATKAKEDIEQKVNDIKSGAQQFDEQLNTLNRVLDEKTQRVEEAKKELSRISRAFDKALKEISAKNDEIEKLSTERYGIYRRCKLEEIELPLNSGSFDDVPIEEAIREVIPMEVDGNDDDTQRPMKVQNFGIDVDFSELDDEEKEANVTEMEAELLGMVKKLNDEIEKMTPNMKAIERLEDVQTKLDEAEKEFQEARKTSTAAKETFNEVKNKRSDLFNKAFNHISGRINEVYKDLTKGNASPMGGVAYLSLEDSEEPYLHGIKYHAMPPMKRFRDMEQLSGGEKTMAALALLFAIHSYHPSPFFVLDEVDAALDNTNVSRIANYVKKRANEDFQFIVISLKGAFYEKANALVGVTRNLEEGGSMVLTLDLSKYEQ